MHEADPRYYTPRWERTRKLAKHRDPVCVKCELTATKDIDHVIPVRIWCNEWGRDFYDLDNLQGLCRPCHRQKTAEENSCAGRVSDPGQPVGLLYDEEGNPTELLHRYAAKRRAMLK